MLGAMKAFIVIFAALFTYSPWAIAQTPRQKLGVTVNDTCDDPVGIVLMYRLKEEIRKSASYSLESNADIVISTVCLDVTIGDKGVVTAASVVVTRSFTFEKCAFSWVAYHAIYESGRSATDDVASKIMADIDKAIRPSGK
jgi:hypothetical protein